MANEGRHCIFVSVDAAGRLMNLDRKEKGFYSEKVRFETSGYYIEKIGCVTAKNTCIYGHLCTNLRNNVHFHASAAQASFFA
ncbi:MAG: hypothetical protein A4E63_01214 [Syntrophorhabdus sp. PtaU1.Bin050]|jgi:hypothetical protein|nr:MAG: hypothetical protein A4E63_01214 [Syntrophorhabdus sp. PtaU1.Bin050]